ncbi:CDGSH iron-sulfur domain-containing protein [Aureibaculum sp. A20]|uniref:CDGSH iron-sulfur domain-containing protein n=1 Tax=Aureibaculum flavum TaxID=2795986 RepID=A0ABS0WRJ3_9FLAO|nr:CDGSH iron-sulfur domain-containing protein [Aureibaculum flavum]MBJ2174546.1 CDGSH iron-sulfur domain-containing protein [Aureibaculum flavum]
MENIKITVAENGPLLVNGTCEVTKIDGSIDIKEKVTAFCRCGASNNKPYCDGEHKKNNFVG